MRADSAAASGQGWGALQVDCLPPEPLPLAPSPEYRGEGKGLLPSRVRTGRAGVTVYRQAGTKAGVPPGALCTLVAPRFRVESGGAAALGATRRGSTRRAVVVRSRIGRREPPLAEKATGPGASIRRPADPSGRGGGGTPPGSPAAGGAQRLRRFHPAQHAKNWNLSTHQVRQTRTVLMHLPARPRRHAGADVVGAGGKQLPGDGLLPLPVTPIQGRSWRRTDLGPGHFFSSTSNVIHPASPGLASPRAALRRALTRALEVAGSIVAEM